ncbi:hypothetical protein EYB26_006988 [Talaromyces marneffei]|uniref:uncharacterized protein n=1 Tax=Talaromyces marneffei TaxID=37727 RepID=UPI0012A97D68|nr:uncharacterized protein EYB26_006988 [Talaromyces marneffei]QGA19299.1 hypothetical protein EYB26_006988 [Talaromyces marneffei]
MSSEKLALSFQDYIQLQTCTFEWGDSYDAKVQPTAFIDYRIVMDERWYWPEMEADDFIAMVSSEGFLGDPCIKTQHLLGGHWYEPISETEVIGHHQLRAAHSRYTDASLREVAKRGHGHATNELFYRRIDGVWKFAGIRPFVRWNEWDFEQIFRGLEFSEQNEKGTGKPIFKALPRRT